MFNPIYKCALAVVLLAMVSPAFAQGAATLPADASQVNTDLKWPEAGDGARPEGIFVESENLQKVTIGLRKAQIYSLLDVPHFSEGLIWPKRWNYLINFYTGNSNEFVTCQFQITFGKDRRVNGTYWRTQQCAEFAAKRSEPAVIREIVREVPAAPLPNARSSEQFVVHFPHDGSYPELGELEKVDDAIAAINGRAGARVTIVGMTDTSGSTAYNEELSERRARNVASIVQSRLAATTNSSISIGRASTLRIKTEQGVKERSNRVVTITVD